MKLGIVMGMMDGHQNTNVHQIWAREHSDTIHCDQTVTLRPKESIAAKRKHCGRSTAGLKWLRPQPKGCCGRKMRPQLSPHGLRSFTNLQSCENDTAVIKSQRTCLISCHATSRPHFIVNCPSLSCSFSFIFRFLLTLTLNSLVGMW